MTKRFDQFAIYQIGLKFINMGQIKSIFYLKISDNFGLARRIYLLLGIYQRMIIISIFLSKYWGFHNIILL
jgi:hypothetical protein